MVGGGEEQTSRQESALLSQGGCCWMHCSPTAPERYDRVEELDVFEKHGMGHERQPRFPTRAQSLGVPQKMLNRCFPKELREGWRGPSYNSVESHLAPQPPYACSRSFMHTLPHTHTTAPYRRKEPRLQAQQNGINCPGWRRDIRKDRCSFPSYGITIIRLEACYPSLSDCC